MILEVVLQRKLIDETLKIGGYGLKLANRFTIGVPDLLIQVPGFPTVLLECKVTPRPNKDTTPIKIGLSPLQSATIDHINQTGGYAGWVLFIEEESLAGNFTIVVGREPKNDIISNALQVITRHRGAPWPIRSILQRITELPPG